jgi:carbamoyltransferase
MNILGINEGHMSSAALIKNGVLVAAVCEERFTRNKNEQGFPHNAIDFCLEVGNLKPGEINFVATATNELSATFEATKRYDTFSISDYVRENNEYWKPTLIENKEINYLKLFPQTKNDDYDFSFLDTDPPEKWNNLFKEERLKTISKKFGISRENVIFVDHHTGHAYYAYFMSPFRNNVLVITADAWGDGCNSSIWIGNKNRLELKHKTANNTLARLYRNITLLLGMKPNEHEYKVMGLAPYATEYNFKKPYEIFSKTLQVDGLDFNYNVTPSDNYFWFKEKLEGCRFDGIAGGLQKYVEETMVKWIKNSLQQFSMDTIVLSGGMALNIKINQKLSELNEIKNIFVPGGGGDESQSIGAALYLFHEKNPTEKFETPLHDYHGPIIDEENVETLFDKNKLKSNFVFKKNITNSEIAEYLSSDMIIGRCDGRSEFGPRALGNRSILANPSNVKNVAKINTAIKYRDFWMPFTPSILIERINDYIINSKEIESPFMTIAFDSTNLAQKDLIGGLHPADFTVRPQFVDKKSNPSYHNLISEFEKLTGIGGLLNTSLNLHGEPIVGSVKDAIHTLTNSSLDGLVIGTKMILRRRK